MHSTPYPGYRYILAIFYGTFVGAGVGYLFNPSPTLNSALDTVGYITWALLLFIAGCLGWIGSLFQIHALELIGLISAGGSILTFLVSILFSEPLRASTGTQYGFASLLSTVLLSIIARGLAVWYQMGIRNTQSRRIRRESE